MLSSGTSLCTCIKASSIFCWICWPSLFVVPITWLLPYVYHFITQRSEHLVLVFTANQLEYICMFLEVNMKYIMHLYFFTAYGR